MGKYLPVAYGSRKHIAELNFIHSREFSFLHRGCAKYETLEASLSLSILKSLRQADARLAASEVGGNLGKRDPMHAGMTVKVFD